MDRSPEAIFDILFIGKHVQSKLGDFSLTEIQFLAYLACLISLYDKNPIAFWKYQFIKNDNASPYSIEIHTSLQFLSQNSYVDIDGYYYKITTKGLDRLSFFDSLHSFKSRKKYLEIVCKSLSIIPINLIKESLKNEPIMKSAYHSTGKRFLLDEDTPALKALYNDFFHLNSALGNDYKSLLAPAVVWLQSLSSKNYKYD